MNTCFSSFRADAVSSGVNQNDSLLAIPVNAHAGTDDIMASFCIKPMLILSIIL